MLIEPAELHHQQKAEIWFEVTKRSTLLSMKTELTNLLRGVHQSLRSHLTEKMLTQHLLRLYIDWMARSSNPCLSLFLRKGNRIASKGSFWNTNSFPDWCSPSLIFCPSRPRLISTLTWHVLKSTPQSPSKFNHQYWVSSRWSFTSPVSGFRILLSHLFCFSPSGCKRNFPEQWSAAKLNDHPHH